MNDSDAREKQLEQIIRDFAAAASTSSAAFAIAGILGSDKVYVMKIHVSMVQTIGELFGCTVGEEQAISILKIAVAELGVGSVATALLTWIPIVGSAANAITTFAYTEKLGRWIYLYFLRNADLF
jgi:uncharacterized protein (DUF697 family)